MNKLLFLFPLGLALGLAISSLYFVLKPQTTIYDRLQNAQLTYIDAPWKAQYIKDAQSLNQVTTFHQFQNMVSIAGNPIIYIDSTYNVLFAPGQTSLVFYFYSEPD
jgi:hypothetical protein